MTYQKLKISVDSFMALAFLLKLDQTVRNIKILLFPLINFCRFCPTINYFCLYYTGHKGFEGSQLLFLRR